jgi:hypothetical protein
MGPGSNTTASMDGTERIEFQNTASGTGIPGWFLEAARHCSNPVSYALPARLSAPVAGGVAPRRDPVAPAPAFPVGSPRVRTT